MRHIAISTWFFVCVFSAGAQPSQPIPEYHSPSEAWLPFFQAAAERFQHDKLPSDAVVACLREAQTSVDGVNQLASFLITNTLHDDLSQYFVLLEASDRAGKRAEQADAELRQITMSDQKYSWMALGRAPAWSSSSVSPMVAAVRADAEKAQAELGEVRHRAESVAGQLNQKFASSIQPHETTLSDKMNELAQRVSDEAEKMGITSKVKVRTSRPGAIAHFQTMAQRLRSDTGVSSQNLTNDAVDSLPIGRYYIWTERNGAASSDKDRFLSIVGSEVTVVIAENQL